jgi:diketogulonate reductase-like aldo/keto reductase
MLYGTAWKQARTEALVLQAIQSGFRAIDTAAQPKHYQEDLVGNAVRSAIQRSIVKRKELYIQTKFTSIAGQDPSRGMPYDKNAKLEDQVHASIASSLRNFSVDVGEKPYLDCLVLHSPLPSMAETLRVWRVLESYVPHQIRSLGISNVYSLSVLENLFGNANIQPSIVQNRFCQEVGYAKEIYGFCKEKEIVFQSFWTLTANPELLASKPVGSLADEMGISRQAALYNLLVRKGGWSILNGTTNEERMESDLASLDKFDEWAGKNRERKAELEKDFESLLVR